MSRQEGNGNGQEQGDAPSIKRRVLISGLALAVIVGLCVAAIIHAEELEQAAQWGYAGVFVIAILAGGTVIVPVPGVPVFFTAGSILEPWFVGMVAGLGEAVGVTSTYFAGYAGRGTLSKVENRFSPRFRNWIRKHTMLSVFIMSSVPNPLYYPFALMAGILKFRQPGFFFFCFAGKSLKNTAIAFLGFWGLRFVLSWFGVA